MSSGQPVPRPGRGPADGTAATPADSPSPAPTGSTGFGPADSTSPAPADGTGFGPADGSGPGSTDAPPLTTRPSMLDVAHLAGVSHQTVSRVLNEHPNVRSSTRMRVLMSMQQLGYRPNSAARTLVTGRSRTIGVIGLDSTQYGPAATMHGVDTAARQAGYRVSSVGLASIDRASVLEAVNRLAAGDVEGVVVIAPLSSARDALADLPTDVPTVVVNAHPEADVATVTVDQAHGAQLVTEHLLATGRGTVWHVAGPANWSESQGRMQGWQRALTAAGADIPPVLTGDWSARSGYAAGQVLARMPEVTAVFVGNDQMALGVLRALHEYGRVVPDDVCFAGFDDIPEAAYFIPPLTTVRQDFSAVGRRCVQLLIGQIESQRRTVERSVLTPELVVRRSSVRPGTPWPIVGQRTDESC